MPSQLHFCPNRKNAIADYNRLQKTYRVFEESAIDPHERMIFVILNVRQSNRGTRKP